jgi:hypothetical protein
MSASLHLTLIFVNHSRLHQLLIDGIIAYWLQAPPSVRLKCLQNEACGGFSIVITNLGTVISGRVAFVQQKVFWQEIPDAKLAKQNITI